MTESFPNVIRSEKRELNIKPGTILALLSGDATNWSELPNKNKKVLELCRKIETTIIALADHFRLKVKKNMSGELGHINPEELVGQLDVLQKIEEVLERLRSAVINPSDDMSLTKEAFLESEQLIEEIRSQSAGDFLSYLNSCLQDVSIFKKQSEKKMTKM